MEDKKEEIMITVPYKDFAAGIQALRITISIRQMLKSGEARASGCIHNILGLKK